VRLSKSLSLFSLQASEAARHFAHIVRLEPASSRYITISNPVWRLVSFIGYEKEASFPKSCCSISVLWPGFPQLTSVQVIVVRCVCGGNLRRKEKARVPTETSEIAASFLFFHSTIARTFIMSSFVKFSFEVFGIVQGLKHLQFPPSPCILLWPNGVRFFLLFFAGVSFRDYTRHKARDLGVGGWIRNTDSGTVAGEVYGERSRAEDMKH